MNQIERVIENKHDCVKRSHQCLVKYRVKSHQVQFEKRPIYISNILFLLIKLRFLFVFGTAAEPILYKMSGFGFCTRCRVYEISCVRIVVPPCVAWNRVHELYKYFYRPFHWHMKNHLYYYKGTSLLSRCQIVPLYGMYIIN